MCLLDVFWLERIVASLRVAARNGWRSCLGACFRPSARTLHAGSRPGCLLLARFSHRGGASTAAGAVASLPDNRATKPGTAS